MDPLFRQELGRVYYGSSHNVFTVDNPESYESKRRKILESLRSYEDETPVGIIEFIESDRYLNLRDFAFPAVYWILSTFYNPNRHFDEFKRDWKGREYVFPGFGSLGLTRDQTDKLRFQELVLYVGMRTAKSWATAIAAVYECYKALCKFPDPQTYFRNRGIEIAPGTMIYISTCATSAEQAGETCGAAIMNFKSISPWFQRYIAACKNLGRLPNGDLIYREDSSSFTFNHKGIEVNSLHSRSGGLVGRARLVAICDEIAKMDESGGSRDANSVYNGLTVGTETFQDEGIRISLSSPTHLYDMINVLFARCGHKFSSSEYDGRFKPLDRDLNEEWIEPVDNMLGFHYPTWDLNPSRPFRVFEARMKKSPVETMRDFGALPSATLFPMFNDILKLRNCLDFHKSRRPESSPSLPNAVYEDSYFDEKDGVDKRRYLLKEWVTFSDRHEHFLHFDAGLGKPSNFAIVVSHALPSVHEYPDANIVHILTKVVFVCYFEADPEIHEVDMEAVNNFITEELVPSIPRVKVSTDRWNSAQLIQRLKSRGVNIQNYLVRDEDYVTLKNQMEYDLVDCYWNERLYEELRRLEKDPRTDKVRKGKGYTKDIADCLAATTALIVSRGIHRAVPGRVPLTGSLPPARTGSGRLVPGRLMGRR